MDFTKAHALGNDFILLKREGTLDPEFIKKIADRKYGIGADQVLSCNSKNEVLIWNQDGSSAKACGNGFRCIAMWLGLPQLKLITPGGEVNLSIVDSKNVCLEFQEKIKIEKKEEYYFVTVGNTHCVYFVEKAPLDIEFENFTKPLAKNHNVSLVWEEGSHYKARVWEKGAGETYACGSAAAAIAEIFKTLGKNEVEIEFKGGKIKHFWKNEKLNQIGEANLVYSGRLNMPYFN